MENSPKTRKLFNQILLKQLQKKEKTGKRKAKKTPKRIFQKHIYLMI
jgi:hypothetical protein